GFRSILVLPQAGGLRHAPAVEINGAIARIAAEEHHVAAGSRKGFDAIAHDSGPILVMTRADEELVQLQERVVRMKVDIGTELDSVIAFEPGRDRFVVEDVIPKLARSIERKRIDEIRADRRAIKAEAAPRVISLVSVYGDLTKNPARTRLRRPDDKERIRGVVLIVEAGKIDARRNARHMPRDGWRPSAAVRRRVRRGRVACRRKRRLEQ